MHEQRGERLPEIAREEARPDRQALFHEGARRLDQDVEQVDHDVGDDQRLDRRREAGGDRPHPRGPRPTLPPRRDVRHRKGILAARRRGRHSAAPFSSPAHSRSSRSTRPSSSLSTRSLHSGRGVSSTIPGSSGTVASSAITASGTVASSAITARHRGHRLAGAVDRVRGLPADVNLVHREGPGPDRNAADELPGGAQRRKIVAFALRVAADHADAVDPVKTAISPHGLDPLPRNRHFTW